jgi:chromosome segregation ATPase
MQGGSGRYPAAVQYSKNSPYFAEYEALRSKLERLNSKLDEEARMHIQQLHNKIKDQQLEREKFDAQVADLKSKIAKFEVAESATSVQQQVSITTSQQQSQTKMTSEMTRMRTEHRSTLSELERQIEEATAIQRKESTRLDQEILQKNVELDEVQETVEVEEAKIVANIAAHKATSVKITKTLETRETESTEKVRTETAQRLKAVRSVYWDHFRSMKDELQRANHMTLTLETRYKDLSKQFLELLRDNVESMWVEKVVDCRVHFDQIGTMDFSSAMSSKQNERLMKQRLDAEVERCCAFQMAHPSEVVEIATTHTWTSPSKTKVGEKKGE